ncbi:MAG: hypothetical protein H0X62_06200 [Bacteroidetes bacterium]|nr:hypothetical protein [Bacteroidota bacterium]
MKTKITLFSILLVISSFVSAQKVLTYSILRPPAGGDLKFTSFDIAAGTETTIKTYSTTELYDYYPEVSTYDIQNHYFYNLWNLFIRRF